jgi:hypothetical protein
VAAPEGKWDLAACCGPDLEASLEQSRPWGGRRWSGALPVEAGRVPRGLESQRRGAALALARTTPGWLAWCSLVSMLALPLSRGGQIPEAVRAWDPKAEPTGAACVTLGRRPRWWVREVRDSAPEAERMPCPREALERFIQGASLAAGGA